MKKRRFTEGPMVRNRVRRTRGLFPRSPNITVSTAVEFCSGCATFFTLATCWHWFAGPAGGVAAIGSRP